MSQIHDTERIFRQVMETAFERRDIDAAAEFFAEDAIVADYSNAGAVHSGPPAIAALIRDFLEQIPDAQHEVIDLVATADRLTAAVLVRGTQRGDSVPIEMRLCVFDVFPDGKILSVHIFGDSRQ